VTSPIARVHAEVGAELAAHGIRIGANDLWIAATALGHGLGVASCNVAEFERVTGLRVLTPNGRVFGAVEGE
jgi:predicted nucleic acid-binding protein